MKYKFLLILILTSFGSELAMAQGFTRYKYETYIDQEGIFPHVFKRDVDEGGYTINQEYRFYQHKNMIDNGKEKVTDAPNYVQDMLSAFYYARTLDFSNAKKGDVFTIYSYVDEKIFPIKIKYKGIKNAR